MKSDTKTRYRWYNEKKKKKDTASFIWSHLLPVTGQKSKHEKREERCPLCVLRKHGGIPMAHMQIYKKVLSLTARGMGTIPKGVSEKDCHDENLV